MAIGFLNFPRGFPAWYVLLSYGLIGLVVLYAWWKMRR
jgi:hypothetical protein